MIPLTVDVPMKRLPWANWGLLLVTVAISLAVPYADAEDVGAAARRKSPPHYSPLVLQRDDFAAYQLATALFQHVGSFHLFGNMLFLFVFGNAINAKLGHVPFLAAYLGIGALVNAGWLLLGDQHACLGASAAIMGLCGMFFVLYPLNGVRVLWDDPGIVVQTDGWIAEPPGWAVILLYLTFNLWGALTDWKSDIGYVSHIAGALVGAGLAVILLKAGWMAPDRGEQTLLQWLAGEGPVTHDTPRWRRRRRERRQQQGASTGQRD